MSNSINYSQVWRKRTRSESLESSTVDLPSEYAEADRIEDGYAVILFFRPRETDGLAEFPRVDRIDQAKTPADELSEECVERDRFRVVSPEDGDVVVATDGGREAGLSHDAHLTESVKRLTETVE